MGISALICGLVFLILYTFANNILIDYSERPEIKEAHIRAQEQSLQRFIDENDISSEKIYMLKRWEYKQPVVILEVYSGDKCIYSSVNDISNDEYASESSGRFNSASINLSDMTATAVLYSDFTYRYYTMGTAFSVIASLVLFVLLFLRFNRKLIRYVCRLNEEVQILEGGNLEYRVSVEGNDEITDLAKSMNRMRESFLQQMETQQQLLWTNKRLITEMSHDLRTPLTGISLYLEILKSHRYKTDAELYEYLSKIDAKVYQMKLISDHLFEYSLEDMTTEHDAGREMKQALSEAFISFKDDLEARGFKVAFVSEWPQRLISVRNEYVWRIFDNISSNIVKYAKPSSEIDIKTIDTGEYCGFSVSNEISRGGADAESSGVGIESVRTMMRQMNGVCRVERNEDVFKITLLFPGKNA